MMTYRIISLGVFVLLGSLAAGPLCAEDEPPRVTGEFVFETAPFASCHASTIAEAADGTIVCAWFGGPFEKHPDVGIWLSRRQAGEWTAPVEVFNGVQYQNLDGTVHRHPCWNPVLFQAAEGPLLLFFKVGPAPDAWWGMLASSDDGGKSWSAARRLPEGIDGPVKNKPVMLEDGTLLCPSSTEHQGWRIHMELTKDFGATWQRSAALNDGQTFGAIQPSILRLGGTRLMAVGRSRQGHVFQIESPDMGRTWGEMTATNMPNPNSGTDAVTLDDGRHLLVYNHTSTGRSPLNVALSEDGRTWQPAMALEDQPGEFSYPAVIQTSDGMIHITYTWKRQRIRYVVLDPARLKMPENLSESLDGKSADGR